MKRNGFTLVELMIVVTATVVDPLDAAMQSVPTQPAHAVPDMDASAFDASLKHRTHAPEGVTPQTPPVQAADPQESK